MATSGRYKSRLLNYLVEQSQKLSEQAGHRFRQARTGVVWGAQVLIYPLYVAFQSSRIVGRRLGGPMPGRQARLTPPRADDVVSSVLKLARNLADEGAITISSDPHRVEQHPGMGEVAGKIPATVSVSQPQDILLEAFPNQASSTGNGVAIAPTQARLKSASANEGYILVGGVDIRGVASELGNRALVLVDNSNRTVPLESEQQWSLQQTIVQQVADFNYRRQRYSQQLALIEAGDRPLPLPRPRTKQLAGCRWMAHLMGWMQTSNLAQSTNLFHESQLARQLAAQVAAPPFLYWDPEPGQQLTRQTLAQLDSPLAGLEQRYIHRHERDDAGTKALRFTAKLFGFEETADQWLRASAAAKAAENVNAPHSTNGLQTELNNGPVPSGTIAGGPMPGTMPAAWTSTDPWGEYRGQLPGNAPPGVEPTQALSGQERSPTQGNLPPGTAQIPLHNPPGWFSGFLNPGNSGTARAKNAPIANPSSAPATPPSQSPKGWQRLTTHFGGLLRNLKQPAGPITPLNSKSPQISTPTAAAPTNANLGLEQDARNVSSPLSGASQNHDDPQSRLNPVDLSDPQLEAALQKRLTNAELSDGGLKSKNVTLRSPLEGALPVAPASETEGAGHSADSADPTALQTTENSVTYESPYIETTAQFNGYERHPLEVILEQLDQILLWIEELGLRLWRWLTNAGEQ